MKKALALLLTLAMLVPTTMTGCKSGSSSATAAADSSKPVNLTFMWWGSQVRHDATLKVTKLYESSHKNVTITPVYQGFDGYFDKLSMMAAANNMPDIIQFNVSAAACSKFVDKKLIEPLDSYISKKEVDTSDLSKSALSTGKLNGKQYGLCLGTNAMALAVDPSIYSKAGLKVPTNYNTWEDLGKDLVKLKSVTGAYGADDVLDTKTMYGYWCRQYGEHAYDSKKIIGFSKKTYTDYENLHKSWINQGIIPPFDVTKQASSSVTNTELAKNKSAVALVYTNQFTSLAQAAGTKLQLIVLPGPNSYKGISVVSSQDISMSSKSKNKDDAAKFISYFINNVDANKILNAERGLPAPTKVLNALKPNFTDSQKQTADYVEDLSKKAAVSDPPAPATSSNIYTLLQELDEQVVYGKIATDSAYQKIQDMAKQDMSD